MLRASVAVEVIDTEIVAENEDDVRLVRGVRGKDREEREEENAGELHAH